MNNNEEAFERTTKLISNKNKKEMPKTFNFQTKKIQSKKSPNLQKLEMNVGEN